MYIRYIQNSNMLGQCIDMNKMNISFLRTIVGMISKLQNILPIKQSKNIVIYKKKFINNALAQTIS